MIKADIHNKLSIHETISEDFLTSTVFSIFDYIGGNLLEAFLQCATTINGKNLACSLKNPSLIYWPWISTETKHGNGAEPDLVIEDSSLVVVIEAKNYAGKSSTNSDETGYEVLRDQLGREYFAGEKHAKNIKSKDFCVIYLTRDRRLPLLELKESIRTIRMFTNENVVSIQNRIYWLNWQALVPVISDSINRKSNSKQIIMLNDLKLFLERRGLSSFNGFKNCLSVEVSYKDTNTLFYTKKKKYFWKFEFSPVDASTEKIFFNKESL